MQDAVDGAELNGYLRSFKQTKKRRNKKWTLMKTAPGVVAEVKTKNYVLSLSRSHCSWLVK